MTTTAAPPGHGVAVQLAASVLAIQQCIGGRLSSQPPRVGAIAAQARAVADTVRDYWMEMVEPVAAAVLPAGQEELAGLYAKGLGEHLDAEAAQGLDEAMDIQLSRNQHPDVAWARATAAYGLAGAAMRSHITAAVAPGKDGAMPLLSVSTAAGHTARLREADRIGRREVTALSTLPAVEVAKAFDPTEARDERGRWTDTGRGVTAREGDEVDELLSQVKPEPFDRYAQGDKYAAVDPRAARAAAYARAAGYAAAQPDRYAQFDRYATPAPTTVVRRVLIFGDRKLGEKPPGQATDGGRGQGLFIPVYDLRNYYHDNSLDRGVVVHTEVDFKRIGNYLRDVHHQRSDIESRAARDGWSVAVGVDVDADAWSEIMAKAVPLWHAVQDDPMRPVSQLGVEELSDVAKRVGYESIVSGDAIKDQIAASVRMRDRGVAFERMENGDEYHYDPVLLDALADYVVWSNPETMGPKGYALGRLMADLGVDRAELNEDPPAVMRFGALADDDDASRLHGQYRVTHVDYHSAIGNYGAGAPPGKIALRELRLMPTSDQERV